MITFSDQPLSLESIVAKCRPRVCDSSDRKAVLRALERFDAFEATRRKARAIRTAIEAEDELGELGVKISPTLREKALEQFNPEAVAELQGVLWSENCRRLESEAGPVIARAHSRMAQRLTKAAEELHATQEKLLEPFGLEAETSSAERELHAAAGWFRDTAARKISLESQENPRRCLSESFGDPL